VVGTVLLVLVLGCGWLLGDQVRSQFGSIAQALPGTLDALGQRLGFAVPDGTAADDASGMVSGIGGALQQIVGSLAAFGRTVAAALSSLLLVVVAAFFLAADPGLYRRGLVQLFPKQEHGRVESVLANSGRALRLWLLAQLISMALVGTLVGLGTWLIGVPAPLALGLFAGLTEFIPLVGPVIGAVPALLLALGEGGMTALWTLLLFLAVQQVESNLIMPMVERRMVEIPPALLLFAVVALGLVFGTAGVIVAAPLTVVLYVLVKQLYVRQTLGEETRIPGAQQD